LLNKTDREGRNLGIDGGWVGGCGWFFVDGAGKGEDGRRVSPPPLSTLNHGTKTGTKKIANPGEKQRRKKRVYVPTPLLPTTAAGETTPSKCITFLRVP